MVRQARVPSLAGVDEDMREWSFAMILEHNVIVNRVITATLGRLAQGLPADPETCFDPKKDVMPSAAADAGQWEAFRGSVQDHVARVSVLDRLRGTDTTPHPLFGDFDAHQWTCLFGFYLLVHYRQALALRDVLSQIPKS
jgi:hypothetical protein